MNLELSVQIVANLVTGVILLCMLSCPCAFQRSSKVFRACVAFMAIACFLSAIAPVFGRTDVPLEVLVKNVALCALVSLIRLKQTGPAWYAWLDLRYGAVAIGMRLFGYSVRSRFTWLRDRFRRITRRGTA